MRVHESSHDQGGQARAKRTAIRRAPDGSAFALTPDSLLRLQRQAGNAAVTSMLTVQRKKTQDYTDGMIAGNFTYLDRKGAPIERAQMTVTEAWFA